MKKLLVWYKSKSRSVRIIIVLIVIGVLGQLIRHTSSDYPPKVINNESQIVSTQPQPEDNIETCDGQKFGTVKYYDCIHEKNEKNYNDKKIDYQTYVSRQSVERSGRDLIRSGLTPISPNAKLTPDSSSPPLMGYDKFTDQESMNHQIYEAEKTKCTTINPDKQYDCLSNAAKDNFKRVEENTAAARAAGYTKK